MQWRAAACCPWALGSCRLILPSLGWHWQSSQILGVFGNLPESRGQKGGFSCVSRIKFLKSKITKKGGEGEAACMNLVPTSSVFVNLSCARRWMCPSSYRSKLYFPAALPFSGLPSTCQSWLLKWFSYSTSPTAVYSCMPPSSTQLAFHTEMAPFKRVHLNRLLQSNNV